MTKKDLQYLVKQSEQREEKRKEQYFTQKELEDIKNIAKLEELITEHYEETTSNIITITAIERWYYFNDSVIKKCCNFNYIFIDSKKTKNGENYLVLRPTIIQYIKYFYWNFDRFLFYLSIILAFLFLINIFEIKDGILFIYARHILFCILSISNLFIMSKVKQKNICFLLENS